MVTISHMTQAEVQVTANVGVTSISQLNLKTLKKHLMLMANDIIELIVKQSFPVLVSNFGHAPIHLEMNTIVGLAMPEPIAFICPTPFVEDGETREAGYNLSQSDQAQKPARPEPAIGRIKSL